MTIKEFDVDKSAWKNTLQKISLDSPLWESGRFRVVQAKSTEENLCKGKTLRVRIVLKCAEENIGAEIKMMSLVCSIMGSF